MTSRRMPRLPDPAWQTGSGAEQDVVVSTRCRLARNVAGIAFPWAASDADLLEISRICAQALTSFEPHGVAVLRPMAEHSLLADLVAARYVSFRWAGSERPGRVHLAPDGSWSTMVNEEDHVRAQVTLGGFEPTSASTQCTRLVDSLSRHIPFAQHPDFGWLTASLGNTGTGMRLSFLLHLAGLASSPALAEAVEAARRMGCAVRGVFGEGTQGTGAFVQVSNRCTWGPEAHGAVDRACGAGRYLIKREREARLELMERAGGMSDIEDAAAGARERILSEDLGPSELLHCLSVLRLAMAVGATSGDVLRTNNWIGAAGVIAWVAMTGRNQSYERMRRLAWIRSDLRRTL